MNDEIPHAANFVLRTLIPAAAAARSLERTASMRRPSPLRRRLATSRQSAITTATTTKPRTGLGTSPSRPRNDARGPRSMPTNSSSGTGEPVAPAPQVELANPNCSIATAARGGWGDPDLLAPPRRGERHPRQPHPAPPQRRCPRHEPQGGREQDPG